ncbi:993_t:CDS:1, partial [Entrophospora sp. SA101]
SSSDSINNLQYNNKFSCTLWINTFHFIQFRPYNEAESKYITIIEWIT